MKRLVVLLLVVAGLSILVVACGPTPTPEKIVETVVVIEEVEVPVEVTREVQVKVTTVVEVEKIILPPITLIGPVAGKEMDAFLPALEAFTEKTDVQVDYRTYRAEDQPTVLLPQFEVGMTLADVVWTPWGWWIEENAEHMTDLTDLVEGIEFIIDPVTVDGKVYGVPYVMMVKPGFWYKKSFFEKHGLETPTTWEEFLALQEELAGISGIENPIATGDGVGWPISDITEHFLHTFGGPELTTNLIEGRVKWTDPEVRAIFEERIVPLLEKDYFSDPIEWTSALEMWWGEEYGLFFMGNWITGMVDDPDDLGVFALPGAESVVAGVGYLFVPQYSERLEDSIDLVAYLVSIEGLEVRLQHGGKLSPRPDISLDIYPPADRAIAEAVGKLKGLPDLDDKIGGDWQVTFWDQLKLLWVQPDALDDVLEILQENMPKE